jgi:hypothetical protein
MLAGAEHSCAMSCFFKNGIPRIVPNMHYANTKALKLQSVSPLYNAQQGGLDVANAWGGPRTQVLQPHNIENSQRESSS